MVPGTGPCCWKRAPSAFHHGSVSCRAPSTLLKMQDLVLLQVSTTQSFWCECYPKNGTFTCPHDCSHQYLMLKALS